MTNQSMWFAVIRYSHIMTCGHVDAVQANSWLFNEYTPIVKKVAFQGGE